MTNATLAAGGPLLQELDTPVQEDVQAAWIRAELTRRMSTPEDHYPHDQVMAEMKAIIASKSGRA